MRWISAIRSSCGFRVSRKFAPASCCLRSASLPLRSSSTIRRRASSSLLASSGCVSSSSRFSLSISARTSSMSCPISPSSLARSDPTSLLVRCAESGMLKNVPRLTIVTSTRSGRLFAGSRIAGSCIADDRIIGSRTIGSRTIGTGTIGARSPCWIIASLPVAGSPRRPCRGSPLVGAGCHGAAE